MNFFPEGRILETNENKNFQRSPSALSEAMNQGVILESKAVMCDSNHNLIIDFGFMKGVIPREEGAIGIREGTVRDIALLSKVNYPVCFLVKDFVRNEQGQITAMLSRREAQELCLKQYINPLRIGDVINVKITHIDPFGVFADIGCGLPALLPIDSISVSRISHPSERFCNGMTVKAVIKAKENGRITLTHKELLGTWIENAAQFSAGETVSGIVRSVESYGIFVELTPNLAGLAEIKKGVEPGQQASVFIKSILSNRMKIKLIIINTLPAEKRVPELPKYYCKENHIDTFIYSPPESEKVIQTVFTETAPQQEASISMI